MLPIKALIEMAALQSKNFNSTFVTDQTLRAHLDALAEANADYARKVVGVAEKAVKEASNYFEAKWEEATDAADRKE